MQQHPAALILLALPPRDRYKPHMFGALPMLSTILRGIARVLLRLTGLGLLLRLIRP